MNLRKLKERGVDYTIGLDLGTGSVGWAVIDDNGDLCHFKGKPTWGSRLFDSADAASVARSPRSQRRRYIRRRWRLDLLQSFFEQAVSGVDPNFFIRLKQSRLLKEDRSSDCKDYRYPLFNDDGFTDVDYYNQFPTIYHLRKWLQETDEKADIRLIYLALHNIVKHRGNFLRQGETLSAKDANTEKAIEKLCEALVQYCEEVGLQTGIGKNQMQIRQVLEEKHLARSARKDELKKLFAISKTVDNESLLDPNKMAAAIANAVVGLKAEMKNIFLTDAEGSNLYLSEDEKVEAFLTAIPPEGEQLFEAMQAVYASFILGEILSRVPGEGISANKVEEYITYAKNLETLKKLVKQYKPEEYDSFFRGEFYRNEDGTLTNIYNKEEAKGYTRYNLGSQGFSYDDFKKSVEKLFKNTAAEVDERYITMMEQFDEEAFLRRLKTSDNGVIPYQLHLEEMHEILVNQGKHYPFLLDNAEKIESLVTFRIPYYVGPLTTLNAPHLEGQVLQDIEGADGKYRFAWSKRKPGKEYESIKPWNWDEVIDTHASAESFIMRMTGNCTYLQGEDVLPKESLLYQEYCVLNELNGAHWSQDGDSEQRFDAADREGIIQDLFQKKRGKVSYKAVQDWLIREGGATHAHVSGGQGESGFESKLSSYTFFCDVLGVEKLPESSLDMIENIILWNTLFEDRSILKERIKEVYGDKLNADQIKMICKRRMTGWGRLSRKFLTEVKTDTDCGRKSIIEILREGHPNNGQHLRALVLMEILHDSDLEFEKLIDEYNKAYAGQVGLSLDDLPGSPALRRTVNQALRIVDEIVGIAGKPPKAIVVEVTRGEDKARPKGQRTKTRFNNLKDALAALKADNPEFYNTAIKDDLTKRQADLDNDRLMLYFMQNGKSLYSGKPLDITRLSEYEVDHIIPQSYIKDDSLDNKALVLREENQRKLDSLLLDENLQRSQIRMWKALRSSGLISEKKFNNLTRTKIGENAMKGFINRQLVETSQIVKFVRLVLEQNYKECNVRSISAGLSHNLREKYSLVKSRNANDFHHAHDAYLACQISRFIENHFPLMFDNPIALTHMMRSYIRELGEEYRTSKRTPGSAGFIIERFAKTYVDKETGEVWDSADEVARIKKCLDYKQCFITKMPEVTSGAFWDATIYSPRSGKNLGLPLKEGLDPKKYGSYSREQFAYFFIYEGKKRKDGKHFFGFESVPVSVAARIEKDPNALLSYAQQLADAAESDVARIARSKIYKKQLIEIDGERFYLTGKRDMRNACQFAFSQRQVELICRLEEALGASTSGAVEHSDEITDLFAYIKNSLSKYSAKQYSQLKMQEIPIAAFNELLLSEKAQIVLNIVALGNAASNVADLSALGKSKFSGKLGPTFTKILDTQGIVFIDQSVTGMFERRTRVGF